MPTKLRILAILLLTITTLAAAAKTHGQDSRRSAHKTQAREEKRRKENIGPAEDEPRPPQPRWSARCRPEGQRLRRRCGGWRAPL